MAEVRWTEVNIVPADPGRPERLLLGVVDPLVHGHLRERLDVWFYFWEPELRLRFRWRADADCDAAVADLGRALDRAVEQGEAAEWYEGAHGRRGETYAGEAEFYGAELWELTSRDWMAGSELALAIVRLEAAGRLEKPRDFHWRRRVHLFSNQLLRDEIGLCLEQAAGYIRLWHRGDPRFAETLRAIDRLRG
jgi:lantibiotic biosynthesis dehydratase-like protein